MEVLSLDSLESGDMPGLSGKTGGYLMEACLVCLAHNGHSSGKTLKVDEDENTRDFRPIWTRSVGDQEKRAHADMQDATEWGACGIACILVCRLTGLVVTRRSRKGTGFDYWLGNYSKHGTGSPQMFQDEARLEVSGILREEKMSAIDRRVREKTLQVNEGKRTDLPAFVVVVEFGRPLAKVTKLEGSDASQRIA